MATENPTSATVRIPSGVRTWTPDERDGDRTTLTVKRCCNGCGRTLGDVTNDEVERVVAGRPLPDVRYECGCTWQAPAHTKVERRVARRRHRCSTHEGTGLIEPGDVYLEWTEYPGGDAGYADAAGRPVRMAECAECASRYGRFALLNPLPEAVAS